MDISSLATAAVAMQKVSNNQETNVAMTRQAIESQTAAAATLVEQVSDQAKAATAAARGGVNVLA
jgi:hypothetical protein